MFGLEKAGGGEEIFESGCSAKPVVFAECDDAQHRLISLHSGIQRCSAAAALSPSRAGSTICWLRNSELAPQRDKLQSDSELRMP